MRTATCAVRGGKLRLAARALCGSLLVAVLASGCGPAEDSDTAQRATPEPIGDQEDEVCGMIVREQSAPRSQITHSDGSRFFFCSIGDMLVHLSAPSPHGRADALFVEVLRPEEDPAESHTGVHPWVRAEQAVYVVGVDRPGIMGTPVLTYATRADAARVVTDHPGAQLLDLAGLRAWWEAREAAR